MESGEFYYSEELKNKIAKAEAKIKEELKKNPKQKISVARGRVDELGLVRIKTDSDDEIVFLKNRKSRNPRK